MKEFMAGGAAAELRPVLFAAERGGTPTPAGVRGAIVEVEVEGGLVDSVAGYADGTARYLNHRGMVIVWEAAEDAEVAARVGALLAAAAPVVHIAGPIDTPVPALPSPGEAQIAVLSTRGILTGRGPYEALSGDPVAGPVIRAAFELMTVLMGRAEAQRTANGTG